MTIQVLAPPLAQTVDTLRLVSWYKREGEAVQQGEPLFAVETDKATLDVEAPGSGVLREVRAQAGDEVKVLSVIAVIEEVGRLERGGLEREGAKSGEGREELGELRATGAGERQFVSPRARRLAEREGVALAEVTATGPQGAVVERDVVAYLERRGARPQVTEPPVSPVARRVAEDAGLDWRTVPGTGPRGQVTREDVTAALGPASKSEAAAGQEVAEVIALSGVRGIVAARMSESHLRTAPVTLTSEADATALVKLREQLGADGCPVSYNDLLIAVAARALRQHPRLNASWVGETISVWRRIDIGLAVDTDRGLVVPVVRDAATLGLAELAVATAGLIEAAQRGRCTPEELTGSTFTITNLGMFGIDAFTPIINLPECAILGVGRIKTEPAWVGDRVEPRQKMWLSLTFDHRLVDGGPAARFLVRVVQLVEKPHLLLT